MWTFTWNLRFHFSLLLHWKNRLEKYTVYWFPHFFSFVHKFVRLVDKFWVIISVNGFLDPICNSVDVIRHSELFENYFLHWNSQQVFWLDLEFTCRTICPRRACKQRNHLHPQNLEESIRPKGRYSPSWGFHLLWNKKNGICILKLIVYVIIKTWNMEDINDERLLKCKTVPISIHCAMSFF